jgi:hypothetical protein
VAATGKLSPSSLRGSGPRTRFISVRVLRLTATVSHRVAVLSLGRLVDPMPGLLLYQPTD